MMRCCCSSSVQLSSSPSPPIFGQRRNMCRNCNPQSPPTPPIPPISTMCAKKRKYLKEFGQHTCSLNKCFAQHGFQIFLEAACASEIAVHF